MPALPPATDVPINAAERERSVGPFYLTIAFSSADKKNSTLTENLRKTGKNNQARR